MIDRLTRYLEAMFSRQHQVLSQHPARRTHGTDQQHQTHRTHAAPGASRRSVRARYDAAQTNHDNMRHWAMADGLSADVAASPAVRRTLRNRARYEVANNSYARGIMLTLANDAIGTGPRLQLMGIRGNDSRIVERAFADWAMAINLAEKLRCMRMARSKTEKRSPSWSQIRAWPRP